MNNYQVIDEARNSYGSILITGLILFDGSIST